MGQKRKLSLPGHPRTAPNNAGIEGQFSGITDLPEEEWDRVLDINLKGTFLCIKHEARVMLDYPAAAAVLSSTLDP